MKSKKSTKATVVVAEPMPTMISQTVNMNVSQSDLVDIIIHEQSETMLAKIQDIYKSFLPAGKTEMDMDILYRINDVNESIKTFVMKMPYIKKKLDVIKKAYKLMGITSLKVNADIKAVHCKDESCSENWITVPKPMRISSIQCDTDLRLKKFDVIKEHIYGLVRRTRRIPVYRDIESVYLVVIVSPEHNPEAPISTRESSIRFEVKLKGEELGNILDWYEPHVRSTAEKVDQYYDLCIEYLAMNADTKTVKLKVIKQSLKHSEAGKQVLDLLEKSTGVKLLG